MLILSTSRFFVKRPLNGLIHRSFQSSSTMRRDFVDAPVMPRAPLEGIRVLDLTRVLGLFFFILKTGLFSLFFVFI